MMSSASTLGRYTALNALQLDLIECPADADVRTVARTMAEHRVHCVVVRKHHARPLGHRVRPGPHGGHAPGLEDATASRLAPPTP